MPFRYKNIFLTAALILVADVTVAKMFFAELRSIPKTIQLNLFPDYAKRRGGFLDVEGGVEFKKNYFTGINLSYNKSYFDYPQYYYTYHELDDFWQRSFSAGLFLKTKISVSRIRNEELGMSRFSLVVGAYLFYSAIETHQTIEAWYHYGMYELPINVRDKKFGAAIQTAGWLLFCKRFIFEPAIQIGYLKRTPERLAEQLYVAGQGMTLTKSDAVLNLTFSVLYLIK